MNGAKNDGATNAAAVLYVLAQIGTYVMAILNRSNFEVALAWVVVSVALSQSVAEFVTFSSEKARKFITLAGILIPAALALVAAYS